MRASRLVEAAPHAFAGTVRRQSVAALRVVCVSLPKWCCSVCGRVALVTEAAALSAVAPSSFCSRSPAVAHQRSPTVHRLEQRVEYEYKDFLQTRCQHEHKRQRQVNTWDRVKARAMELKHCDELANKWKGHSGVYG